MGNSLYERKAVEDLFMFRILFAVKQVGSSFEIKTKILSKMLERSSFLGQTGILGGTPSS